MNLRRIGCVVAIILVVVMVIIYRNLDPTLYYFFPRCPSYTLFGLKCAGCGSQRAIHALLNFELSRAISFNPLFVISIPFVAYMVWLEYFRGKLIHPKSYKTLFGSKAIRVYIVVILIYNIIRNIWQV